MGSNLIMGRKTWDSLPGILPGREHFVLSRGKVADVAVITVEEALEMEGWIIGGGQIYEIFLPHVNELHRTIIDARVSGADTFFPDITGMGFRLEDETHVPAGDRDEYDMVFQHWIREK